ncbi:MAG: hypothetical protein E7049_03945 [Lentisphaerae bacterium]|nr:hypothetical protein [Lentisphaerota bacterium]
MKAMQIKRAVLAAAIFAGASVAYGVESALQVVYCKAMITEGGENGSQIVSVTLPPTEGYYDNKGNPLTYWNVGNVPAGGVADSWHGEGGPGRFTAHNEGNVGAYFYVTTGDWYAKFTDTNESSSGTNAWDNVVKETFVGGAEFNMLYFPAISPNELRRWNYEYSYHLAFTTDTMAKVPTWHSLDHRYTTGSGWSTEAQENVQGREVAGYMGYVDAGDYLTFDLKFWAPRGRTNGANLLFTFCVEASAFPLWEHGRAVE